MQCLRENRTLLHGMLRTRLGRRFDVNRRFAELVKRFDGTPPRPSRKPFGIWTKLTTRIAIPLPIALWMGADILQHHFGTADNFFKGTFITDKDPNDLAEFYSAEDLLKIIAMHPILFDFFMNKVQPTEAEVTEDTALLSTEETNFKAAGLGLDVSFEIIQQEDEVDGEEKVTSFMRHERFVDYFPILDLLGIKLVLWDQTWTYGFQRLTDGRVEVFHHGERFYGPWPIRMIIFLHQYYVLLGCESYINGDAFGTEDNEDRQQEQLSCTPMHMFKEFVLRRREKRENQHRALKHDQRSNQQTTDTAKVKETVHRLKRLSESQSTGSLARRKGSSDSVDQQGMKNETMTQSCLDWMVDSPKKPNKKDDRQIPQFKYQPGIGMVAAAA
eukprot:TRINITY_DN3965_c0_g1_i1.p1 TRINITY_DN3965_c0_g1~~TRINITY_DN3965_c0_g1_i1.p1  ORF type:complete len:386 (+),score=61.93 TRINITY_DN3965_c0_g1_i1:89-1246(+)